MASLQNSRYRATSITELLWLHFCATSSLKSRDTACAVRRVQQTRWRGSCMIPLETGTTTSPVRSVQRHYDDRQRKQEPSDVISVTQLMAVCYACVRRRRCKQELPQALYGVFSEMMMKKETTHWWFKLDSIFGTRVDGGTWNER